MDRTANKAKSFGEAAQWEREQAWSLTPDERLAIAKTLRERVYGRDAPDVRASDRLR